ncbi:MAG: C40 family peptidase, partial [Candidatus Gracilibacteria bacterium]|nr:C40 family peptidase [Candidatus Gracilibacteria bacterium]
MFDFGKKKKQKEKASLLAMLGIGAASLAAAFFLSERYKPEETKKGFGSFGTNPWSFKKMSVLIAVVVVLMMIVQFSGLDKYFKTSLFDPLEQATILEIGEKEIGKPYCLGGTGPDCFDCSGYVQSVMKRAVGVNLPRTSRDQATIGEAISLEDAGIGDLVFFYTNPSAPTTVSHVGILATKDGKFLNANSWLGKMMYDDLNVEYWLTRLAGIREIQ